MTLPPIDDALRPVYLAVRSLRLLGVLFVLLGAVTALQGLRPGASPLTMSFVGLTHAVPGVLYLLCALLLLRGRRASVFAAMGLAMGHFILVAGNLAAYVRMLVLGGTSPTVLFVALTVGFLTVAALAQLMYHLVKSLSVLRPPVETCDDTDPAPAAAPAM
jgi:hypothetical protein